MNVIPLEQEARLEKICAKWPTNKKRDDLIRRWFAKIFAVYDCNNNFIEKEAFEVYIDSYLAALEKVVAINLYTLEEILKSAHNYFYEDITIIPQSEKVDNKNRIKKEGDKYYLHPDGEYYLPNLGICDSTNSAIVIIEDVNELENFHHELTHIVQGEKKYKYPIYFPFANGMNHLIREGNAQYNQRILSGKQSLNKEKLNEENVLNQNAIYLLYVLLMISFPEDFRKKWVEGDFDTSLLPNNMQLDYADLFAIISILTYNIYINDSRELDEVDFYKSEYNARKEIIENNYLEALNKLKEEVKYLNKLLEDENRKNTILGKEKIKYLSDKIADIEEKQKEIGDNKKKEIIQLEFGKNIANLTESYIKQNLTITELLRLLITKVQKLLVENNKISIFQNIWIEEDNLKI